LNFNPSIVVNPVWDYRVPCMSFANRIFAIIVVQSFDCYTRISFGKTFYDKSFSCFSLFFRVLDLLCFLLFTFQRPPHYIAVMRFGKLTFIYSLLNSFRL
jgi:hypothetical protein